MEACMQQLSEAVHAKYTDMPTTFPDEETE